MAATLYRVQTRTDAIEGYDDVLITWAAEGRTSPVAPYADVIEGLGSGDEADLFRRNAVDELFTFEEAQAWVAYLQRHYSSESSEVVEQPLPLPGNPVALSDMPVGSGVDQKCPYERRTSRSLSMCMAAMTYASIWQRLGIRIVSGRSPTPARSRT
jgi:hypothetical protein